MLLHCFSVFFAFNGTIVPQASASVSGYTERPVTRECHRNRGSLTIVYYIGSLVIAFIKSKGLSLTTLPHTIYAHTTLKTRHMTARCKLL